jgi:ubiquinone/menaquinone biosynthesis C-methylase UbiE
MSTTACNLEAGTCVKVESKERDAMSTANNPRREHPSTYFVQDRSNEDELTRLQIQGRLFTAGMGGVLPEQPDPTIFQRVLDVGCGPGNWLIEAAKTYPSMTLLVGVDVSSRIVAYAQAQAEAEQVSDRVQFRSMDALRMLEFPVDFFDLVNHRSAASWLRTWDWPKLLQEYQRVCRSGGVIRVTESDFNLKSSSPGFNRLNDLCLEALCRAGHYFTAEGNGVMSQLARLLHQYGVQNVQTRACTLVYRAGTPEGQHFVEDMRLVYRTILPFLKKWIRVPEDYETIYQQAFSEMQQPDFVGMVGVLTAWGTKR